MRARIPFVAPWLLAALASMVLSTPIAALAQSMPGHDRSSMPGMDPGARKAGDEGSKPAVMPKRGVRSSAKRASTSSAASPAKPPAVSPTAADMSMEDHHSPSMTGMPIDKGHDAMPSMDPGAMQTAPAEPAVDQPVAKRGGAAGPGSIPSMGAMQGGVAPPDARDPDAYADGLSLGHMPGMDMADDAKHLYVLVDRVEVTKTHGGHGQALDAQAWYGGDLDKLWLKVDGERSNGRLGATRTEALWNHAIATYWSLQTGVRQDFGDGPGRTWSSLGVQGLSPYWFDVQATAYLGEGGRTALRLEAEYDLLVTQRLVLQPDVKIDVFGRDDVRRGIGAGLSQIGAGLRLRYEVTRKLAPYIGVVWNRKFGNTARFVREGDEPVQKIEAVAGVRLWF